MLKTSKLKFLTIWTRKNLHSNVSHVDLTSLDFCQKSDYRSADIIYGVL